MSLPKEELLIVKEEARGASHHAMGMLINSLPMLYDSLAEEYFHYYEFGKSVLADVAKGEKVGLATHLPQDFAALTQTLSEYRRPLKIGAIICPDWNGHYEGKTFVYDMNGIGSGIPQTAFSINRYISILSERAQKDQVDIRFTGHFPGWEFTRTSTTHDVPQQTALEMLERSAESTQNLLKTHEHSQLSVNTIIHTPPGFHENVSYQASELLQYDRRRVEAVHAGRKSFHKGHFSFEAAAREYAEAKLAWELLGSEHIILVATSPTIARASLSGHSQAWIQLQTGYRG